MLLLLRHGALLLRFVLLLRRRERLLLRYDISFLLYRGCIPVLFRYNAFLRLRSLRSSEDFILLQNLLIELRLHENKARRKVEDVKGGKEHIGK